jgi:hypothetical protein
LSTNERDEILGFLRSRPIHTVHMESLIRDNGVESEMNRGTFYGCRDSNGTLHGVALIGHSTILETRSPAALRVFANVARDHSNIHLVMGEVARMEEFWPFFSSRDFLPRLSRRELLFEQRLRNTQTEHLHGVRLATKHDLEVVALIQAELAIAESGIDPLQRDRLGFTERCARRIGQGRVWVFEENKEILFKADVQSLSKEVAYLEGVWVDPRKRRTGIGSRALSYIAQELLASADSVCLFAEQTNLAAHALYRRAGFKLAGIYDAVFPN